MYVRVLAAVNYLHTLFSYYLGTHYAYYDIINNKTLQKMCKTMGWL